MTKTFYVNLTQQGQTLTGEITPSIIGSTETTNMTQKITLSWKKRLKILYVEDDLGNLLYVQKGVKVNKLIANHNGHLV